MWDGLASFDYYSRAPFSKHLGCVHLFLCITLTYLYVVSPAQLQIAVAAGRVRLANAPEPSLQRIHRMSVFAQYVWLNGTKH